MDIQAGYAHFDSLNAYLAQPTGHGPYPGIVVIQEIFGVNAHIRDVTERLAREGFVAVAPPLFHRTAPDLDLGYSEKEVALGRSHKEKTTEPQLLADIRSSIRFLGTLGRCAKGKVGTIGFCFGGRVAFLAAMLPEVAKTASFYGAGSAALAPRLGEIHGEVYAFFGDEDPLIPREHVETIETALGHAGVKHKVFRYPTGHGFFCDKRKDYHEEYAKEAWAHVRELFSGLR